MTDHALMSTTDKTNLTEPDILDTFAAFLRLKVAQGDPSRRRSAPTTPM